MKPHHSFHPLLDGGVVACSEIFSSPYAGHAFGPFRRARGGGGDRGGGGVRGAPSSAARGLCRERALDVATRRYAATRAVEASEEDQEEEEAEQGLEKGRNATIRGGGRGCRQHSGAHIYVCRVGMHSRAGGCEATSLFCELATRLF